jgi:hypothetical protein
MAGRYFADRVGVRYKFVHDTGKSSRSLQPRAGARLARDDATNGGKRARGGNNDDYNGNGTHRRKHAATTEFSVLGVL